MLGAKFAIGRKTAGWLAVCEAMISNIIRGEITDSLQLTPPD